MSAPLVWIAFPAVVAGVAFLFRRWKRIVLALATGLVLGLALLAWLVPVGELVTFGPLTINLSPSFVFAGRQFVLNNVDRPLLMLIYLALGYFFAGSYAARASTFFIPLGLAMGAVLIASLAVQPFLYASLLIEVAVLISVPLLAPPGEKKQRGVLRYLTFLSFGMPFLLLAGWLLSDVGGELTATAELLPALVLLGLGFAFLLAIFPLNTWIPMLTESVHPYSATFVLTLLPIVGIALLQRFLGRYPWLLDFDVILFLGLLMVVTGGLWAAFQRDLGRLLGYAVIVEVGRSLVILSQPVGESIYALTLVPRLLTLGLWALSLSVVRTRVPDLRFSTVQGFARRYPLVAAGILVATFSLAGFPLLANFAILLITWQQLAAVSFAQAIWMLVGSIGLLIGGLRTFAILVMGPDELPWDDKLARPTQILIFLGIILIVLMGFFPQWILSLFPGNINP